VNFKPTEKKPLDEFLLAQGRFQHLKNPKFASVREDLRKWVDRRWSELLSRAQTADAPL
jgi:pyruvate ferredoxin oxidoreductase beta subunit